MTKSKSKRVLQRKKKRKREGGRRERRGYKVGGAEVKFPKKGNAESEKVL